MKDKTILTSIFLATLIGINLFYEVPKSLHIDESLQFQYTSMSLKGAIEGSYVQNQPPLGNLIGFIFGLFVEPTNFTLRIPSLIFSLLSSILLQRILCTFIGKYHSIFATLFIFINPLVFTYSRYSRSYALCLFFIVLFIFLLLNQQRGKTFVLPLVACLIPWSRTIEGSLATVVLWVIFIASFGGVQSKMKRLIWSILVASNLIVSLVLTLNTGGIYRTKIDLQIMLENLFPRIKLIIELGDGNLSLLDATAAISIIVLILIFSLNQEKRPLWIYLSYVIISIGSPLLILSTSTIPLFPRYLFFYSVVYAFNLYLLIYLITRKINVLLSLALITSLFVFSAYSQGISRSPFPPFYEAGEYLSANSNKHIYAFLPGDFNQFMAAWPVQPGIEKGTVWISTFVKNGGELPDSILIFPYVNPSYEVQKILQPNTGEVVSLKDLGGGLGIIDLATNSNQKLEVLSKMDFGGSELWLALVGLRMSYSENNSVEVVKWLNQICEFADKSLSPGTLFGDFASPQISIEQFLVVSGLPRCTKAQLR